MPKPFLLEAKDRFDANLTRLLPQGGRIGIAVSGGPDSLALLLVAASVRPGEVEAATVDHQLREGSSEEASAVAAVCRDLDVPHATLLVTVASGASLQAQARGARYDALAAWARARGLAAALTAHHADDQAETLLMRLARGSGLAGLAGVRAEYRHGGATFLRPLLDWRKAELEAIVAASGLTAVDDPANRNPRHDRSRVRTFMAGQDWLDPQRLASAAAHLAEAEEALSFAAGALEADRVRATGNGLTIDPANLPRELQRRLLLAAMARLRAPTPRGPDLDRALVTLESGGRCTLSGLLLQGGAHWVVTPEPPRALKPPAG